MIHEVFSLFEGNKWWNFNLVLKFYISIKLVYGYDPHFNCCLSVFLCYNYRFI